MNSITVQELKASMEQKRNFLVIDVRATEEYKEQHIPFAKNIPLDELHLHLEKMISFDMVITVCGKGGGRSERAANLLLFHNLNACFLDGGTAEWFKKMEL